MLQEEDINSGSIKLLLNVFVFNFISDTHVAFALVTISITLCFSSTTLSRLRIGMPCLVLVLQVKPWSLPCLDKLSLVKITGKGKGKGKRGFV